MEKFYLKPDAIIKKPTRMKRLPITNYQLPITKTNNNIKQQLSFVELVEIGIIHSEGSEMRNYRYCKELYARR